MHNASSLRWIGALLLLAPLAAAQGTDQKINGDPPGTVQNETVLAIDTANPQNVVIAFNDRAGSAPPTPIGLANSQDGGLSWTERQLSVPPDPFTPGNLDVVFDPFLTWGPPNEFYAGYIATQNTTGPASGIFVERSDDGGVSWSGPTTIAVDGPAGGPVNPAYRFNDRPHIDSAPHGFVAVTWIKDVGVNQATSDIYFAYSNPPVGPINTPPFPPTNLQFTTPVTVNDMPNGTDMGNAPHVATHPLGTTYVAWIDYNVQLSDAATGTIKIDSTMLPSAAPVFGADVNVAVIDPQPRNLSSTLGLWDEARAGSYPAIVTDDNDGTGLTVLMTYAADPTGPDEGDVFFIKTVDGGATWSAPLRVNDDATTNDQMHPQIHQFFGGAIWIVWYDKRNSPTDNQWDVYASRSNDGGLTFKTHLQLSDTPLTAPTSTAGAPWLGEYLGIDSDGANTLVAFTTSYLDGRGDVYLDRMPCQPFLTYCTPGTSASGCTADISASGIPSASAATGFLLRASTAEGAKNGIFFFGTNGQQSNPWGNGTSLQCVVPPVMRGGLLNGSGTSGACDGIFAQDLNARWCPTCPRPLQNPGAGALVQAQLWHRDPLNTSNQTTSLSDAIEFVVCP
jgi:hypothetical protein